ncbi:AAA family ATPase [Actinomadura hibisca]|uniref:AAA family ATPase n=1 Tax=Actinomadura hibisca TaxID=68565 RepID=UPI0008346F6F|nr:AAA family ATPase [Actinomadura hibisca]
MTYDDQGQPIPIGKLATPDGLRQLERLLADLRGLRVWDDATDCYRLRDFDAAQDAARELGHLLAEGELEECATEAVRDELADLLEEVHPDAQAELMDDFAYGAKNPRSLQERLEARHPPPLESGSTADQILGELLDGDGLDAIPAPEWLVAGWLERDSIARLNGPSGSGKSFVALDWAACVGAGQDWHGHQVRQGRSLYMIAEGADGFGQRKRAWESRSGRKLENVQFLARPLQATGPEWDAFVEACRRIGPDLIVIDTQARITVGVDENSALDMGVVVDRLETLRQATGACVVLVHHTGYEAARGRGSSAVPAAITSEFVMSGKPPSATLANPKQKNAEQTPDLALTFEQVTGVGGLTGDSLVLATAAPAKGGRPPQSGPADPEDKIRKLVEALQASDLDPTTAGRGAAKKALLATLPNGGEGFKSDKLWQEAVARWKAV